MRTSPIAVFALLVGLAAACGKSSSSSSPAAVADAGPTGAPRIDPDAVHVDGRVFRDGRGRQLLFRGYNAKATVTFDVVFDDGRTANETFDDFTEAAAARFESLGLNVLRLPLS